MKNAERQDGGNIGTDWEKQMKQYREEHPLDMKPKTRRERRAERRIIDGIARNHPEIYLDSDNLATINTKPYIEKIYENEAEVIELARGLESRIDLESGTERAVQYLCGLFELEEPTLAYENKKEKVKSAYYEETTDILSINLACISSPAELVGTVAHELWHKHQYETDNEAYKINWNNYYGPENFNAFRNQLIENEAFMIEEEIGKICRKDYAKRHPELKRGFWTNRKLEREWLDSEYLKIAKSK